jgi:Flp pilus assembly protein TadG
MTARSKPIAIKLWDLQPELMRALVSGGDTSRRRGTAAAEFAIVLPLVLLLALASCDFGRIAHFHQIVANAARTGAETGATHQFTEFTRASWEAGIRQSVVNEMGNIPDFNESEMGYELSTTVDSDGVAQIAVEVSYPFRTVVAWPALPSEVVLRKYVEFRQFR